jgi:hypothetical protein
MDTQFRGTEAAHPMGDGGRCRVHDWRAARRPCSALQEPPCRVVTPGRKLPSRTLDSVQLRFLLLRPYEVLTARYYLPEVLQGFKEVGPTDIQDFTGPDQ